MVAICPSSIQRGIKKFIQSIKCYFFRCVFVLPFKIDMRLVSSICCSLLYYRVFKLLLLNIIQFNTRKVFKCFLAVCYIYCTLCFQSCRELVGQLVICYFFLLYSAILIVHHLLLIIVAINELGKLYKREFIKHSNCHTE